LLTTVVGIPRRAASASSWRAIRVPKIDVSATAARHSRVRSSTTTRIQNRRGDRVPVAGLRATLAAHRQSLLAAQSV
jgi:hypothetical protein